MAEVSEHTDELGGQPVFWRSAPSPDPSRAPVLYLHGVPTNSDLWIGFLERTGGIAPDLPGFGRSGKRADGDYTMPGYDRFIEAFLDARGIDRVRLLVSDWGAVGLLWAQRFPERVERLVVVDAVPLLPGYRWHRIARAWRTRGVGEVVMGSVNSVTLTQLLRESNATPGSMPADFRASVLDHFDLGTQRAILRLYRSADPPELERAGARLGDIRCPALVVWGDQDPYIPPRFADAYAAALGGPAQVVHLPDAGHWPWLDRPDLIDTVSAFLDAPGR